MSYKDASGKTILSELSPTQIANLTPAQMGYFTKKMVQSLSYDQVSALTLEQLYSNDASGSLIYNDLNVDQINEVISLFKDNNKISYSSVLNVLKTMEVKIGSGTLTEYQLQYLESLMILVQAVYGKKSYIGSILTSMIDGDPAGHAGLSVGMTLKSYDDALNQWFMGTNNPKVLSGDHYEVNKNPLFSTSTNITQMGSVISQGYSNGDCWLVAAIAATATVNPDLIKSMIVDNGNGTYGVRFYNTERNTVGWVTVDNQLPTYTGIQDSDNTIWGGIIEKAYIEAQYTYVARPKGYTNTYEDNQGARIEGVEAITGMLTDQYSVGYESLASMSKGGTMFEEINTALNKHETVVMITGFTNDLYGLINNHVFEVIGIDQSNDNYILQNPWGPNAGCTPFELSASQLYTINGWGNCFEIANSDGTLWAPLIEKAYIEAQADGIASPKAGFDHNSYKDNEGGWDQGITAITGMKTNKLSLYGNVKENYSPGGKYYEMIDKAFENHETVTFGSFSKTDYGLIHGHMYEVLGIDHSNNNFIFENPWGYRAHRKPFEVSSSQLEDLKGDHSKFFVGNIKGPGYSNYKSSSPDLSNSLNDTLTENFIDTNWDSYNIT